MQIHTLSFLLIFFSSLTFYIWTMSRFANVFKYVHFLLKVREETYVSKMRTKKVATSPKAKTNSGKTMNCASSSLLEASMVVCAVYNASMLFITPPSIIFNNLKDTIIFSYANVYNFWNTGSTCCFFHESLNYYPMVVKTERNSSSFFYLQTVSKVCSAGCLPHKIKLKEKNTIEMEGIVTYLKDKGW